MTGEVKRLARYQEPCRKTPMGLTLTSSCDPTNAGSRRRGSSSLSLRCLDGWEERRCAQLRMLASTPRRVS